MKKNVASQTIGAQMVSATDGSAFTGTVSCLVTGDAGTQGAGSGSVTHEGNGYHSYAPTQAETNYDHIAFTFTGTGAIPATIQVYTTFPQTGDSFARLGAPAGASVSADVAAVKTQTAAIETDTQDIQSRLPASLVSGRIDASVGAMAANVMTASALATDAVAEIVDGVWDEVLTGDTHNVPTSAGRRLRQVASAVVHDGLAQGAGTGTNQIQLDTDASSTDGAYDPAVIAIIGGTGSGQCRLILQYEGSTRTCTVDRDWKMAPDDTSEFIIYADAGRESVNEGLISSATNTTAVLNADASSADDAYIGQTIFIRSGTGQDQARTVTDYVGSTKTATVDHAWSTNPDSESGYVMLPTATCAAVLNIVNPIKSKTDSLAFTVSGQVDANIQYVNDVEVTGNGESGTEWGPA